MFADLDRTVRAVLEDGLKPFLQNVDISFDCPDSDWRGSLKRDTLNVFLYDIRENPDYRDNERLLERMPPKVGVRTPRARVDCRHLVSAWSAASPADPAVEHRLLGRALWALFRYPAIPAALCQGYLQTEAGKGAKLTAFTAQGQDIEALGEIWSSLGTPWKPSLHYTVTVPFEDWHPGTEPFEVRTHVLRTGIIEKSPVEGAAP